MRTDIKAELFDLPRRGEIVSNSIERTILSIFLACLALTPTIYAQGTDMDRHSITIYSSAQPGAINPSTFEMQASNPGFRVNIPGYAMVRTVRPMTLAVGETQLRFDDVAAGIDPTTVTVKSLTHPSSTRVLEQNYQYDLVSTERMMDRFLGQEITIQQTIGSEIQELKGRLMTSQRNPVLALEDGRLVALHSGTGNFYFPNLPDGLITRPTLEWLVRAEKSGSHQVQVSYETRGMTWWTDYNLILDESNSCAIDVNAWVTIVNQSGGSFADATLKLIAGDVNRAPKAQQSYPRQRAQLQEVMTMAADGFVEESFFEYHLYTLSRPATLADRSIKQLELFPTALGVPCRKSLVFDAGYRVWRGYGQPFTTAQTPFPARGDVKVFLEFDNKKDAGLGIPLPAGRIRVSQLNSNDGNLEFIGEDLIDHTPRNERVSVKLGNAFDVVGERSQTDFRWDRNDNWMEETIEVKIRNQKEETVLVSVWESLIRWSNWEILRPSHEYEQRDAASISFELEIGPEQEEVLTYTTRYEW